MKSVLLALFKGSVVKIVNEVIGAAMERFKTELEQAKHLNDVEKSHVLRGAELLSTRVQDEIVKRVQ